MDDVVNECAAKGSITGEGIRHFAALHGKFARPSNLLTELRNNKALLVTVVGSTPSKFRWTHPTKSYCVTLRRKAAA